MDLAKTKFINPGFMTGIAQVDEMNPIRLPNGSPDLRRGLSARLREDLKAGFGTNSRATLSRLAKGTSPMKQLTARALELLFQENYGVTDIWDKRKES